MPRFGHLDLNVSKTNVKFKISTFKIGDMWNFVKIGKTDTFWPKIPKFGILGSKFSKKNDKFEISTFKIGYMWNFVKIGKSTLFDPKCPNLEIWARNLKNESQQEIPDSPNLEILGRFELLRNFLGSFWLFPARFSSFQILVSTQAKD